MPSNIFKSTSGEELPDVNSTREAEVGLAEGSFYEPEEQPQTRRSRVSSGLIRAGIGGAIVLLAVIGLFGLIGGFSDTEDSAGTPVAATDKPTKNSRTAAYKALASTWTQARTTLDNTIAAGREQVGMNRKEKSRILAQQKRVTTADAAVTVAQGGVAEALRVSSAARDSLDDLLGEKLSRKLQLAKDTLNTAITDAEDAQKAVRASKGTNTRMGSALSEMKKAAAAAQVAATAADVVVSAAKSARLVMAENEDIIDQADSPVFASLEIGFFKEAGLQADAAGRSALVASKAVTITQQRMDQLEDRLRSRKVELKNTNKAEKDAYLAFASADKAYKLHTAQKRDAEDQTEETFAALASAERRLEESRDNQEREAATLQEMNKTFEISQKMSDQHDIKVAAAQVVFDQAEINLRGAQRIRSIKNAATLATLNADLHDRLRKAIGTHQGSQPSYDRFVLSSEALFEPGSARLGRTGRQTIAKITDIIEEITSKVPEDLDWMLRVDGHTDATPLSGNGSFKDNWALSQARALSVVKHLIKHSNIPARHMSANGFGEFQPISSGSSLAEQAANRRIEIVLTSR